MAIYKHITRTNGDTILAQEWNNMGLKLQSINSKYNEQNALSGPLRINGDSSIDGELMVGKNVTFDEKVKMKDDLLVQGIARFDSTVTVPKSRLGAGTKDNPATTDGNNLSFRQRQEQSAP